MSIHKAMDNMLDTASSPKVDDPWRFQWPNLPDFNFNYYKLMADAAGTSIGKNRNPEYRVAIVGAGVAGLTAARELFRSGYTNIDIYEASDRICGRLWSIPAPGQTTCFEMGAMRMPFFTDPEGTNSMLAWWRRRFDFALQQFPDPGSKYSDDTGIYLNEGYGPTPVGPPDAPEMLIWKRDASEPPTPPLQDVFKKWQHFSVMFTDVATPLYGTPKWEPFWQAFVQNYWKLNFRELVYLASVDSYDPSRPGWFGGLGMNRSEADLFYTIGAGDGSWGAFYDISCLYVIRTILFGFALNAQLLLGRLSGERPYMDTTVEDSLGNYLSGPAYLGVASIPESLFYEPVRSELVDPVSLYDACRGEKYGVNLLTRNPVTQIEKTADGVSVASPYLEAEYDAVVLTPPTWATQLSMELVDFDAQQLPFEVRSSIETSHWIRSCKVFYPLFRRYWGEDSKIPQIIATDTELQGVYGFAGGDDPGVLLVSYTWEDDANKFLADPDDADLAEKLLARLDQILLRSTNIGEPISPYVDTTVPAVIHWARQPSYRGCAKLYRERTWNENYALLRYNQDHSAASGLYFAGEAYSVTGGWTEPALRGGIDAAVHVIQNSGGTFLNDFTFSDYPRYTAWNPSEGDGAS